MRDILLKYNGKYILGIESISFIYAKFKSSCNSGRPTGIAPQGISELTFCFVRKTEGLVVVCIMPLWFFGRKGVFYATMIVVRFFHLMIKVLIQLYCQAFLTFLAEKAFFICFSEAVRREPWQFAG